jgi:hypothetical protein
MPQSAHTALVVSIIASVLGALVMCLLVARYGLRPATGQDTERGLLATRFGHALAGVCFAATGILSLVILFAPTGEPRPTSEAAMSVEPDRAAEARLQALTSELKGIATRLEEAETRVTAVDGAARRLGDEVGSMGARAKELERKTAARVDELERTFAARTKELERTIAALPRRSIVAEPPAKETKPAPAPSRAPERPTAPAIDPLSPAPLPSPAPQTPEPTAAPRTQTPEQATAPRTRTLEPVVQRAPPAAARAPEPAASSRVAPSSGRATIETPAPRGGEGSAAMAKPDDGQLGDKIREDWKTIRGGLATAGDDFKAAVRDLGRKLWR